MVNCLWSRACPVVGTTECVTVTSLATLSLMHHDISHPVFTPHDESYPRAIIQEITVRHVLIYNTLNRTRDRTRSEIVRPMDNSPDQYFQLDIPLFTREMTFYYTGVLPLA